MSYNTEKLLHDAKQLSARLHEHDSAADQLITQAQSLHDRMVAMKEYQEDLTGLNELARHRPRSALILGIAQENKQIRDLQAENRELRMCVEEQQSALELIMSKYRRQVAKLILANRAVVPDTADSRQHTDLECALLDRISDMCAVMAKAAEMDEASADGLEETIARLRLENSGLRQIVHTHTSFRVRASQSTMTDSACQTRDSDGSDRDGDTDDSDSDDGLPMAAETHSSFIAGGGQSDSVDEDDDDEDEEEEEDTDSEGDYDASVEPKPSPSSPDDKPDDGDQEEKPDADLAE